MQLRPLGRTGLNLSPLSFGASSLGQEFRPVDLNEAIRAVHVALDSGMNFIDTSPYYGRGMSECLLGVAGVAARHPGTQKVRRRQRRAHPATGSHRQGVQAMERETGG